MPVALGCAPQVLLAIFVGIARGLLRGLKGNAFKIRAMHALAIKGLGLGGEARLIFAALLAAVALLGKSAALLWFDMAPRRAAICHLGLDWRP
jgi:hypothetical protein